MSIRDTRGDRMNARTCTFSERYRKIKRWVDVTFFKSSLYFSRSSSSRSEFVSSDDFLTYTLVRTPRLTVDVDCAAPSLPPITQVYA